MKWLWVTSLQQYALCCKQLATNPSSTDSKHMCVIDCEQHQDDNINANLSMGEKLKKLQVTKSGLHMTVQSAGHLPTCVPHMRCQVGIAAGVLTL